MGGVIVSRSAGQPWPDHDGAVRYALDRLARELAPHLTYHNLQHTRDDVLPAAERLAQLRSLVMPDRQLLRVAAAFHDLGHVVDSLDHERIGVASARSVLPPLGFTDVDLDRIEGMILATRMPQTPLNDEQSLLVDADLDSLGRDDFLDTSRALWLERRALGHDIPWARWLVTQRDFLLRHRYFTDVARALRDAGKQRNLERLERLIHGTGDGAT